MQDIIDYIISFLLYNHSEAGRLMGYTDDKSQWHRYRLVVTPCENSPLLHPEQDHFLPDLTRQPKYHDENGTLIVDTDIIYNSFFLLSRCEELINLKRDVHGRFLAEYSHLGQHELLSEPLVDKYGLFLLEALGLPLPKEEYAQINLTHDIDTIAHYRHLRGFLGGIKRGQAVQAVRSLQSIHNDPAYTFSWLIEQEKHLPAKQIYFMKATQGKGHDYPQYDLQSKDCQQLIQLLKANGAEIGLHASYYASLQPNELLHNKKRLEEAIGQTITANRYHFLNTRNPIDYQTLIAAGITDDYTLAFPDRAGFRIGTCRAVRWIDPIERKLTSLTLHPLTIMDCTLSNSNYMNLKPAEAHDYALQLMQQVRSYNGELTLLWHNSNVGTDTYHRKLYAKLIDKLQHI